MIFHASNQLHVIRIINSQENNKNKVYNFITKEIGYMLQRGMSFMILFILMCNSIPNYSFNATNFSMFHFISLLPHLPSNQAG